MTERSDEEHTGPEGPAPGAATIRRRWRSAASHTSTKALADYVHSKGLKIGIYSLPGPRTCQGLPGSYQHEEIDARTWAAWGFDLLKHDWCSYDRIAKDRSLPKLQKPYIVMARRPPQGRPRHRLQPLSVRNG